MSVEKILDTLNKLERMHRSLLELSTKKTEIIKANDMEQLTAILKTEQAHVAAIETLEQQRQMLVIEYFQAKGMKSADQPTVTQLIEVATAEEKPELAAIRDRLLAVVDELKKVNTLNQKLVMQSLQFINFSLDLLQPSRAAQTNTFNYSGAEVRGTSSVGKKSYFNSEA